MTIDLLASIHFGDITLDYGESVLDDVIANGVNWWEELKISRWEATAYAHGATLQDLLLLRYQGWPTVCTLCDQPMDYTKFGWWFSADENGHGTLRHINGCPTEDSLGRSSMSINLPPELPNPLISE